MVRLETFPEHMIIALYKSFERIKPVRVLLKIAKPEEMPSGLPSNVLVRPWFQQTAVLSKNIFARRFIVCIIIINAFYDLQRIKT